MATVYGYVQTAGPVTKTRRDQTTYVLNEVMIDGQVYVARKDVCNLATGMLGQHVEAVVRAEQKGTYTNYYLDFIQLAGGGAQPGQAQYVTQAQAAQQQVQPYQAAPVPAQPAPAPLPPPQAPPPIPITRDPVEQERTLSIHRQTAAKVAGVLGGSPIDFWANVASLVEFFQSGRQPFAVVAPPAQSYVQQQTAPQPVTNQFVPAAAYGDPGPDLTKPEPYDEGIPF